MLTLEERCKMAQECLPDAPYRAMLTALHNDLLEAMLDASRMRYLDKNSTFFDVDADFDTEGRNIPVLASVSKRIWYHATDDVSSYPLSAVADAAILGETND